MRKIGLVVDHTKYSMNTSDKNLLNELTLNNIISTDLY